MIAGDVSPVAMFLLFGGIYWIEYHSWTGLAASERKEERRRARSGKIRLKMERAVSEEKEQYCN